MVDKPVKFIVTSGYRSVFFQLFGIMFFEEDMADVEGMPVKTLVDRCSL